MSTVLVTGGSGFVGAHCILQLLAAGHSVRTTVRSAKRETDVRAMLREGGAAPAAKLGFHIADLTSDAGWAEAVHGCEYVLHVASPFPESIPKHENELIVPARDGALRVLRAARDAGVRRVVLTSSFAAIGYGHPPQTAPFDETAWTNLDGADIRPYVKSKAIAERAAWDFIQREGGSLELAVINPVGIFGPVLGPDYSTSILLVQRLMDGAMPGCPKLSFGAIDVRDVADLHLRAMTDPAAKGERFLAVAGDFLSMQEIAKILKRRMGDAASRVPTRQLPNWLVRLASLRDPAIKQILPELGKHKNATSAKAQRLLGWTPRSAEDAITATAESLVRLHLLKHSPHQLKANDTDWTPSTPPLNGPSDFATAQSQGPILVHFWASWNAHDRRMDEQLAELKDRYKSRVEFFSCDIDRKENRDVASRLNLMNVPALGISQEGEWQDPIYGCRECADDLASEIDSRLSAT